jgi:hypothetical protein
MSAFEPPPTDPVLNPYAAPEVEIGGPAIGLTGDLAEAEAIRRAHINHEATVKGFGALTVFGAAIMLIAVPFLFAVGAGAIPFATNEEPGGGLYLFYVLAVLFLVFGLLSLFVGIGMRRLQPWARWAETALMSLQVLTSLYQFNPVGLLFSIYILYLMLSAKGAMVFSPRYKEVIALTPHVKYKTSRWVKILLIVLLVILGLIIAMGVIGALLSRGS